MASCGHRYVDDHVGWSVLLSVDWSKRGVGYFRSGPLIWTQQNLNHAHSGRLDLPEVACPLIVYTSRPKYATACEEPGRVLDLVDRKSDLTCPRLIKEKPKVAQESGSLNCK